MATTVSIGVFKMQEVADYIMVNRNSGKALDVSSWSTADGAEISNGISIREQISNGCFDWLTKE